MLVFWTTLGGNLRALGDQDNERTASDRHGTLTTLVSPTGLGAGGVRNLAPADRSTEFCRQLGTQSDPYPVCSATIPLPRRSSSRGRTRFRRSSIRSCEVPVAAWIWRLVVALSRLKHALRPGPRSGTRATCLPASGCGPPQPKETRASGLLSRSPWCFCPTVV